MWSRRVFATLCIVSMLFSAGCCPEGTVPCEEITIRINPETGKAEIHIEKTCVLPGTCPVPNSVLSPEVESLLASFGVKLLQGLSTLDPSDVKFRLDSKGAAPYNRIQAAVAEARAYRLDEQGRVADEARLSTPLDIVADMGKSWILSPQGGPEFDQFVREAARILTQGAPTGTFFEYSLELSFEQSPEQLAQEGLDVTLVVAGIEL